MLLTPIVLALTLLVCRCAGKIDESTVPIYKHENPDVNLILFRFHHPQSGGNWWYISENGQFDVAEGDLMYCAILHFADAWSVVLMWVLCRGLLQSEVGL